jgi:Holliday junction resolvase
MPKHHPDLPLDNEAQVEQLVARVFDEDGWRVESRVRREDFAPDLVVSKPGRKLVIEVKRASEGRRDRVIPLLSQAALEAAHYSQKVGGRAIPVAVVAGKEIPGPVAEQAMKFMKRNAPDVAAGIVDLEGLRFFAGHGLESLNADRRKANGIPPQKLSARAPQLFSDLRRARKSEDVFSSPGPRVCLGLFEAAEALGLGFVHGVKPYLYIERVSADILEELGLSANVPEGQADVHIRIPRNRESVFRGVVRKEGVPTSDIVQAWLDVSQHPSRGREQADLLWRRILAPVFEANATS